MKKNSIIFVLAIFVSLVGAAQNGLCPPNVTVLVDTNYPNYLFDRPIPTGSSFVLIQRIEDEGGIYHDGPNDFRAMKYVVNEPTLIYGIAFVGEANWSRASMAIAIMEKGHNMQDTICYLAQKHLHSSYVNYNGYPYYLRPPIKALDISFLDGYTCNAMHEEYFPNPILVNGTFYAGIIPDPDQSISSYGFPFGFGRMDYSSTPHTLDNILLWEDGHVKTWSTHCQTFWGGCFPILQPYEGDCAECNVQGFRLHGVELGYPTFKWDTDFLREDILYQVQYAPAGTENWQTTETTDSSLTLYAIFDRNLWYQARMRTQCHHLCPMHDTLVWSPWSDTILFYTGVTPPDTSTHDTTAIIPVGEAKSLFSLTPNPTTGEVQVIVKSEKLKDKSCTVTVLDAAGHEVLRTTLNSQLSTLNLNLSSLPAGAYFVTLTAGTLSATQKLILR